MDLLNQAARYADRMVVLNHGRIVPDLLAEVFHVRTHIITDPASNTPVCLPYAVVSRE
jgi:ABC-type cobalamin/Fe3+-siderophores transport system ATPase subunit